MIWSDSFLDSLLARAEIEFSRFIPSIFCRFSLATSAGTSVYDISSNNLLEITRVTWKGEQLDPYEHAADTYRSEWVKPQNQANQSKPMFYLSYDYGYGKIKFHPVPNETIAADDSGILAGDIENRVIITGYCLADPTGTDFRIPEYLRRRFTKYYAMQKVYLREGPGQDLRASKYFGEKYQLSLGYYKKIIQTIPKSVRLELGRAQTSDVNKITVPRPTLPSTGAWGL